MAKTYKPVESESVTSTVPPDGKEVTVDSGGYSTNDQNEVGMLDSLVAQGVLSAEGEVTPEEPAEEPPAAAPEDVTTELAPKTTRGGRS